MHRLRLGLVAAFVAISSPVLADCYEVIGCTDTEYFERSELMQLGCEPLWTVRNTIYARNGYCFRTDRAIQSIGNDGCFVAEQEAVKLNAYEWANIGLIVEVERARSCGAAG